MLANNSLIQSKYYKDIKSFCVCLFYFFKEDLVKYFYDGRYSLSQMDVFDFQTATLKFGTPIVDVGLNFVYLK